MTSVQGHGIGDHAPGIKNLGTDVYTAAHNQIRAHAKAYRAYHLDFAASQGGNCPPKLSVALSVCLLLHFQVESASPWMWTGQSPRSTVTRLILKRPTMIFTSIWAGMLNQFWLMENTPMSWGPRYEKEKNRHITSMFKYCSNFRTSKFVNRHIWCSSGTPFDLFWGSFEVFRGMLAKKRPS